MEKLDINKPIYPGQYFLKNIAAHKCLQWTIYFPKTSTFVPL